MKPSHPAPALRPFILDAVVVDGLTEAISLHAGERHRPWQAIGLFIKSCSKTYLQRDRDIRTVMPFDRVLSDARN